VEMQALIHSHPADSAIAGADTDLDYVRQACTHDGVVTGHAGHPNPSLDKDSVEKSITHSLAIYR